MLESKCASCGKHNVVENEIGVYTCVFCGTVSVSCEACEPKSECLRCKHAEEANMSNKISFAKNIWN